MVTFQSLTAQLNDFVALALRPPVLALWVGHLCLGTPFPAWSFCLENTERLDATQSLDAAQSRAEHFSSLIHCNDDVRNVYRQAQAITVKVFASEDRSSGILLQKQGPLHTVLTNQHGLIVGAPYRIQTPDGKIYAAIATPDGSFASHDLALLKFRSPNNDYAIAKLGRALSLAPRTPVFAAGFPVAKQSASVQDFTFTSGQVSIITTKVLAGGYQLGYTNPIEKGMSGGPVLNLKGEVIAINGIHQEPLWGSSYVFSDGSKPSSSLKDVLARSSWAIPVEVFVRALHSIKLN